MNPADNIEREVEQLHLTTRPETDKRILDDAFVALEKSAQEQSPHVARSARPKILRIRIAEYAAVAAVILVVFALFFGTPAAEAVTFAQIIQAVEKVRNVCVSRFVPNKAEPTQHVWSSLTMNIKMYKSKREGQMEYVLYDIPNRVRKIKYVSSGLVKTDDVSADLLAQTVKSMISSLGMVPFKDTHNLPEGAQWNLVEEPNVLAIVPGTEVYDLTWSETRGAYTHYHKWRVFVDFSTNLPKRTESYLKINKDMEYEFYRFIIITYPSESQIRTLIQNEFGSSALQPRDPGYIGTPQPN